MNGLKRTRVVGGVAALLVGASGLALAVGVANAQSLRGAGQAKIEELEASGQYLTGDKHNHTTCTDGITSVEALVKESTIIFGLDWFAQTGHGGEGARDCRFDEPLFNATDDGSPLFTEGFFAGNASPFSGQEGDVLWVDTLEGEVGEDDEGNITNSAILGDDEFSGGFQEMWRWQSISEFAFQEQRFVGFATDKPTWIGLEHVVPGHEHGVMAVLGDQFENEVIANAFDQAQFEYLWDRADEDTSGGEFNDFENPANNGVPKEAEVVGGFAGHARSVASVEWLRENFPVSDVYWLSAHTEREGGFVTSTDPTDTSAFEGYNVEHLRDYHTAGLVDPDDPTGESISFGAEFLAGHQFARGARGTYELDRPTSGFGTYGGAGAYGAAEVTVPNTDFDGNELIPGGIEGDPESGDRTNVIAIGQRFADIFIGRFTTPAGVDAIAEDGGTSGPEEAGFDTGEEPERYVLGRPSLATMWDALLGEGRRFFIFGSSDWHNRGEFAPFEAESTFDPFPGEYSKIHAYAEGDSFGFDKASAQAVIEGMRVGNTFSVNGDLIDKFFFVACQGLRCATMGETLQVLPFGRPVVLTIRMRDPEGTNNSPYLFPNPSLQQLGVDIPLNEPVLSHIDIIRGDITGPVLTRPNGVGDPNGEFADDPYFTNVSNPTVRLFRRAFNPDGPLPDVAETAANTRGDGATVLRRDGDDLVLTMRIPARRIRNDQYVRVRGTNMPVGTPFETNEDGDPVLDFFSLFIPCRTTAQLDEDGAEIPFTGCPAHLPTANEDVFVTFDPSIDEGPDANPAVAGLGLSYVVSNTGEGAPTVAAGEPVIDADVEAWADLWFYGNPIFFDVFEPRRARFRGSRN